MGKQLTARSWLDTGAAARSLRDLLARERVEAQVVRYGQSRHQSAELVRPRGSSRALPVVVLLHGGYWKARYTRHLMRALALDVARTGWLAYNLEYRRVGRGGGGGGWPATACDVAAGIDFLAGIAGADAARVVLVGHSAGGHLALWAAARHRLAPELGGGLPRVAPRAVIGLAPVSDLEQALRLGLGGGAVARLLGDPRSHAQRLAAASPMAMLPLRVPQIVLHDDADDTVPAAMSRRYVRRARDAGDEAILVCTRGSGHMGLIDPASDGWRACRRVIANVFAARR